MSEFKLIFESDRQFQLWRYAVSHSKLLLRSSRTDGQATSVDVCFNGVRRVSLDTLFVGLRIYEHVHGPDWGSRLFKLEMGAKTEEIIAVRCWSAEGDFDYWDESPTWERFNALEGVRPDGSFSF